MKLLGRKNLGRNNLGRNNNADDGGAGDEAVNTTGADQTEEDATTAAGRAGTTAPKGRPTPKRNDRRRGPVAPAPLTAAEARKRRKEMRASMTREERRAEKAKQRAALSTRRERMLAGEEAYLLPRDRGPLRRYMRDTVDSRRHLLGMFLPAAIALIFVSIALPQIQYYFSPIMLVFLAAMAVDAVMLGRRINRAVDAKFPDNTESNFKLGLYAASRASQLRRMRIPRPQVPVGAEIA